MITIDELLTPLTAAAVRATLVTMLVNVGVPADQWRPNGTFSTILTYFATMLASFTVLFSQAIGLGFLPTASGSWLALLAYYVYGVTVPAATFASGALTFVNAGGGVFTGPPYAAGKVIALDPVNGLTYTNTEDLNLDALATQTIGIQCTTAGAAGSAPPGEISQLVTTLLEVTVSNAAAVVGQDAPDDATVRAICFNRLGASSVRGPRTAYAYAAQVAINPVTGAPVNINRVLVTASSHTGKVGVVVASPQGAPAAEDVAGVVTSIESGVPGLVPPFSGARPDGVTVTVTAATEVPCTDALTIYAVQTPGLQPATVETAAANALLAFIESYPIGGYAKGSSQGLFASGIEGECLKAHPAIFAVDGAVDHALVVPEVAVDAFSIAVVLVPPP